MDELIKIDEWTLRHWADLVREALGEAIFNFVDDEDGDLSMDDIARIVRDENVRIEV